MFLDRPRLAARSLASAGARIVAILAFAVLGAAPARAQLGMGNAFTYQGSLVDGGAPANGSFDFQFSLFDDASAGTQIGSTLTYDAGGLGVVTVTQGVFTVALDFSAGAFDGGERWLAISVQPAGGGGYTALAPRVAIRPAPYALFAEKADAATVADTAFALSGEAHVMPRTTAVATDNATNLQAAYAAAKLLTPHGLALSADNRAAVLVPPGRYDFGTGTLLLDAEFVDVVGLSTARDDQYLFGESGGSDTGVLRQTADDVRLENLRVRCTRASGGVSPAAADPAAYFPDTDRPATIVRNCEFEADDANALSMRACIEYSGRFENCVAGAYGFGAGNGGASSGTFLDCTGGVRSFGAEGSDASGAFTDCTGGDESFGGFVGTASGTFTDCTGGAGAFGGISGTADGTFIHCVGGDSSFGGSNGYARGLFIGCTGGANAFGGGSGFASNGRFYHCNGGLGSFTTGNPNTRHLFCTVSLAGLQQQYSGNE